RQRSSPHNRRTADSRATESGQSLERRAGMRRLVLLGSGHGELSALPILMRRILQEKDRDHLLFVDNEIIRAGDAVGLVKWDKAKSQADYSKWIRYVSVAARRKNLGGVLAVFDGDAKRFPAGSQSPFC